MRPPYPIEGAISWNMNTICNYRCSYCTQRFVDNRKKWARDLPAFVRAFSHLAGDWELKLSGGEPFRHPNFLDAVEKLAQSGMRISVVSNFSSPKSHLEAFASATDQKPGIFSASLHLEYVKPQDFLQKLTWFRSIYSGSISVTCVATRKNMPELPALKDMFADFRFKVQPEKQDRDVIAYTPDEKKFLLDLGGHNLTGEIAPNFKGRLCWAGSRYLIVDHLGEAYRCYPARRYRQEYLGNVLTSNFRLSFEPKTCLYEYCNCTVPQSRSMMMRS